MNEVIARAKCIEGGIYHLRNLTFGAYDGNGGFIGIREKFWQRFLFTEYHREGGLDGHGAYGTASPLEKIGQVPEGVLLRTDIEGKADQPMRRNEQLWQVLEVIESAHARAELAAGRLWKGNDIHGFWLMSADDAADDSPRTAEQIPSLEIVNADTYFAAQDSEGVCMGMHCFDGKERSGRIVQGR